MGVLKAEPPSRWKRMFRTKKEKVQKVQWNHQTYSSGLSLAVLEVSSSSTVFLFELSALSLDVTRLMYPFSFSRQSPQ